LTVVKDKWFEAGWLVSDEAGAGETLQILEITLQRLSVPQRRAFLNEITTNDEKDGEAKLRELVAYELLHRLKLRPIYHPTDYGALCPDLSFLVDEKIFLGEVFVSFNPSRTVWAWDNRGSTDAGDRAHKITERLAKKYKKYKEIGVPLVFFVFPGDRDVKSRDVELALYGASMGDPNLVESFPWQIQGLHTPGSFFLPDENGSLIHEMTSAVVWCEWFYRPSMDNPGMRLHVLVYHHWKPAVPIAPNSFRPFPELVWKRAGDYWTPSLTQPSNLVARFVDDRELVVRQYTANQPW
jgi:hypothetical protein